MNIISLLYKDSNMTLFPLWAGNITLPALPAVKVKIGDNFIHQHPSRPLEVKAQLVPSNFTSHDILETNLPAPFGRIAIRRKKARKREMEIPVLICTEDGEVSSWNRQTHFKWEDKKWMARKIYFSSR